MAGRNADVLDLGGRVAVVTGAASGQGRAAARRLHRAGAMVAALDLNTEGLATLGDGILTLAVDTSDPDRVAEAFEEIESSLGPAYILASAAAVWAGWNSIVDMDYGDVERIFRINTFGTLYCVKNAARQMIRQAEGGRIIMWSSIAAARGQAGDIPYSGSKAALEGMARPLAAELAQHEITVNVIAPGAVDTPMLGGTDLSFYDTVLPGRRIGTPDEIAELVAWLCSPLSRFVTGAVIPINGGVASINGPWALAHTFHQLEPDLVDRMKAALYGEDQPASTSYD